MAVPGSGAVLEARLSQLSKIRVSLKANVSGPPSGSFSCPLAPPGGNAVHHHRGGKRPGQQWAEQHRGCGLGRPAAQTSSRALVRSVLLAEALASTTLQGRNQILL